MLQRKKKKDKLDRNALLARMHSGGNTNEKEDVNIRHD